MIGTIIRETAKLLVVTADYDQAKDVTYMLKRAIGLNAEIATSHNSKEAVRAIKHFKAGKIVHQRLSADEHSKLISEAVDKFSKLEPGKN